MSLSPRSLSALPHSSRASGPGANVAAGVSPDPSWRCALRDGPVDAFSDLPCCDMAVDADRNQIPEKATPCAAASGRLPSAAPPFRLQFRFKAGFAGRVHLGPEVQCRPSRPVRTRQACFPRFLLQADMKGDILRKGGGGYAVRGTMRSMATLGQEETAASSRPSARPCCAASSPSTCLRAGWLKTVSSIGGDSGGMREGVTRNARWRRRMRQRSRRGELVD